MKILIGMETSQVVSEAFKSHGHDVWSCDLLPADNDTVQHMQCDIYTALRYEWDIVVMHPPCTALCVSGNHVYAQGKPRHSERIAAVNYTNELWSQCIRRFAKVCFENPTGVLTTMSDLPEPQYVQPYEFGEDASKRTALFLHNLPRLVKHSKNFHAGRTVNYKGKRVQRWSNQTDSGQNKLGPSEDRWKKRSKSYPGIWRAAAEQWS